MSMAVKNDRDIPEKKEQNVTAWQQKMKIFYDILKEEVGGC